MYSSWKSPRCTLLTARRFFAPLAPFRCLLQVMVFCCPRAPKMNEGMSTKEVDKMRSFYFVPTRWKRPFSKLLSSTFSLFLWRSSALNPSFTATPLYLWHCEKALEILLWFPFCCVQPQNGSPYESSSVAFALSRIER